MSPVSGCGCGHQTSQVKRRCCFLHRYALRTGEGAGHGGGRQHIVTAALRIFTRQLPGAVELELYVNSMYVSIYKSIMYYGWMEHAFPSLGTLQNPSVLRVRTSNFAHVRRSPLFLIFAAYDASYGVFLSAENLQYSNKISNVAQLPF